MITSPAISGSFVFNLKSPPKKKQIKWLKLNILKAMFSLFNDTS